MLGVREIEEEAARWAIRVDSAEGDTAQLTRRLRAWLAQSPVHAAAYLRVRTAWKRASVTARRMRPLDGRVVADLIGPSSGPQDVTRQSSRAHGSAQGITGSGSGAYVARPGSFPSTRLFVAGFVLFIGFVGWNLALTIVSDEFETELGGRRLVLLDDGSQIQLNTDSRVRVYYSQEHRRVHLEKGEAVFSIEPDPNRPFEVQAGHWNTRALGTEFAVRLCHDGTEVMVTEGKVSVTAYRPWWERWTGMSGTGHSMAPRILDVGDEVIGMEHSLRITRTIGYLEVHRRLAWLGGRIELLGETLTEAVAEFNRYNKAQMSIADPSIARIRMTGSFSATEPGHFVGSLTQPFGIRALAIKHKFGPEELRLVGTGGEKIR